jgi:hypothetical protein
VIEKPLDNGRFIRVDSSVHDYESLISIIPNPEALCPSDPQRKPEPSLLLR